MGLILRVGPGYKKADLYLGNQKFKKIDEFFFGKEKITLEKTKNFYVDNIRFLERWKFSYLDENQKVKSYILGHPIIEEHQKCFYIKNIQSKDMQGKGPISNSLSLAKYNLKKGLSDKTSLIKPPEYPFKKSQNGRSILKTWFFIKEYLRDKNFKKLLAQADYRFYDTLSFDLKLGWKDKNRERKIEEFKGNPTERKKRYNLLEKITGVVYLEYPLE
jgi:hypothetical protein